MLNKSHAEIKLTEKQKLFIRLICMEKNPKQIAAEMNISIQTVYGYKRRILAKIEAKSDVGIVVFAYNNNLYSD